MVLQPSSSHDDCLKEEFLPRPKSCKLNVFDLAVVKFDSSISPAAPPVFVVEARRRPRFAFVPQKINVPKNTT